MRKFFAIQFLLTLLVCLCVSSGVKAENKSEKSEKKAVIVKKKRIKKTTSDAHDDKIKSPEVLTGENSLSGENAEIENVGIQAVLVLDSSRSMLKTDPKKIRDQGVRLFLQFLEPQDYFSILQFSEDSKIVLPFTKISQVSSEEIATSLRDIQNDGNFTDFLAGLELAESLFAENSENKKNYKKVLILMTDGQNDPNPSKHSAETVKNEILKARLPALKKKGIRIYTLALSELADQQFLAEMSKNTNGLSWYADELNEVHRIFSDLFLTLKKPQVLELTKDGFEIDSSSNEATFFVQRNKESESIAVIDPSGNEYTNKDFPGNWKWFRGSSFDVITVPSPIPGTWSINGGDGEVSGFAKLLTKLNLEHDWPEGTLSVGDSAVLRARLIGDSAILNDPQVKNLIFYSYKVINLKNGNLYMQGKLSDNGLEGDQASADGIFSTTITLNEEGNFKIFLSAIGPTFSRQSHIPVTVSRGLISLEKIPANEFTKKPESYLVKLHGDSLKLKNRKVSLVSELIGVPNSRYGMKLSEDQTFEGVLPIPTGNLKQGENKSYAVVSGLDAEGHEVRAKSEEILIVSAPHENTDLMHSNMAEEQVPVPEDLSHENSNESPEGHGIDEGHHDVEKSKPTFLLFGLIGPLLSLVLGGLIARIFIKKSKQEKGIKIELRSEYLVPQNLETRLSSLISRGSGARKRALRPEEIEVFSVLPELVQGLSAMSQNVSNSESGGGQEVATDTPSVNERGDDESVDEKADKGEGE